MKTKKIKIISFTAILVLITTLLYIKFEHSRTHIMMVNFPEDRVAELSKANPNFWNVIKHVDLKTSNLEELKNADIALFFHVRGLDGEQTNNLNKAKENGLKYLFFASTSKEFNENTIVGDDSTFVVKCLSNADGANDKKLLNYLRKKISGKELGTDEIQEPIELPNDVLYHLGTKNYFENTQAYWDFYQEKGLYKKGKPVISIINTGANFNTVFRSYQDLLVKNLESKGYNVVCIGGFKKRFEFLKEIKPAMVLFFAHGRIDSKASHEVTRFLKENNTLLLMPQVVRMPYEKWESSQQGLDASIIGQNVVMPELDGGTTPFALAAQYPNEKGILVFKEIPGRVEKFAEMADRWLKLRDKTNEKKKIAIYYYKGAGKNAIVAEGLEVVPSLFNLLKDLKGNGYDLGNRFPDSHEKLWDIIQKEGPLLGDYALGSFKDFVKNGQPALITTENYKKWCESELTQKSFQEIENAYGQAPGNYLVHEQGGIKSIALPRVQFGNVVLLPVLPAALNENEFKYTHGVKKAPPHAYVASYLWTKNEFKADVVMHFGTHGSIEFTPWKQIGLSAEDWPESLIAPTPHLYIYTINNIGEAMMAKRRTYATMLSHLTPPYDEAQSYSHLKNLDDALSKYADAPETSKINFKKNIKAFADSLKIGKDLELDEKALEILDENTIETLTQYVNHLKNEKITMGLHRLGENYEKDEFNTTVKMMVINPLEQQLTDWFKAKTANAKQKSHETAIRMIEEKMKGKSNEYVLQTLTSNKMADSTLKARIFAILDQVDLNFRNLSKSPLAELSATRVGASGAYISSSSGGDAVFNPMSLPTGRNLYAINPDVSPSIETWETGKLLADKILQKHIAKHGDYPKKLAYTLWGSEFIRDEGLGLAQIFYLMGVRPLRNQRGSVFDVELIPMEELKRPRIDVVVQTSGQFRDVGTSRISLINKAAKLASTANDETKSNLNYVSQGRKNAIIKMKEKGISPAMAEKLADIRVFGGVNGNYGTGIMGLVEKGDRWETDQEIAQQYLQNMGAVYSDEFWSEFENGVFEAMLQNTEAVVHPRSSHQTGPISLDHVYEFMGGITATIRNITGKDPDGYFHDSRNKFNPDVQNLKEAIWAETRTNLLNPKFVSAQLKEGETAAENFAENFRDTYGWNVMKPDAIDPEIWEGYHKMYVKDELKLGTVAFFKNKNPYALQEMTAVMMETIRKGYWKPSEAVKKEIAALHAQLVKEVGAGCSGFVCDNNKLKDEMLKYLSESEKKQYLAGLQKVLTGESKTNEAGSVTLKQQKNQKSNDSEAPKPISWLAFLVIGLALGVFLAKKFFFDKKQSD
ncbi:MAG: cobaltochelatase subunit CobN [Cytophagales bacterium]